jgi:DNA-binding NtrC family response regulator
MGNGQFREDLYYRLNVVEIQVPPLRERKEEVPLLASSFLKKFTTHNDRKVEIPAETLSLLAEYPWPGNVRELENTILRLVVLGNVRQVHEEMLAHLRTPPVKRSQADDGNEHLAPVPSPEASPGLREVARRAAQEAERKAIQEVLDRVHWNRSEAARLLKVSYKTLLTKITECGLSSKQTRGRS